MTQVAGNGFGDTWLPFSTFGASGLRRTQASVHVSYSSQDIPPMVVASGNRPLYLRILMTVNPEDPPSGWPADLNVGDDILCEPLVWTSGVYQPPNTTFGRPEFLHYSASLVPGLGISKGQRNFGFGDQGLLHWAVIPLSTEDAGPGFDDFTVAVGIRQLWDDSPSS